MSREGLLDVGMLSWKYCVEVIGIVVLLKMGFKILVCFSKSLLLLLLIIPF